MHDYKKLRVWEESVKWVTEIYLITKTFPKEEKFGLVSQINRCSVSVSSNIAEGAGRNTNGEFKNQLGTAAGSIFEMETQLLISKNLNYITKEKFDDLMVKVEKIKNMLYKLINSLK